jgi:glycosyltransferase involved in cell wall biosynthesis
MVVHGPVPPDPRVERAIRVAIREGWEVDVFATRQAGQREREVVEGATVKRLPISHRWGGSGLQVLGEYISFTILAAMKVAASSVRRSYTAVHIHNPPDFLISAGIWPKLFGAKLILDVHDLAPDMFAMRFGDRRVASLADRILRLIERGASRLADFVITVHEPYRRELVTRGVPRRKITVVMNTVDEPPVRTREITRGRDFRIVYHGTLTPPYGVHLLVEAAAMLVEAVPNLRVEIYGDGDRLEEIRSLAHEFGIPDRVHFSGRFLPRVEVLDRIGSASAGVVPNLPTPLNRFALSTKLFEYVTLRIPVVVADLPTIREHFNDTEVLFFRAGDSASLANALLELRRQPETGAERAEAALKRYEEYQWPVQASRYAQLLRRCLEVGETSLSGR